MTKRTAVHQFNSIGFLIYMPVRRVCVCDYYSDDCSRRRAIIGVLRFNREHRRTHELTNDDGLSRGARRESRRAFASTT